MCGIVAVLTPDPRSCTPGLLAAMRDRLIHRGPDGAGQWIGRLGGASIGLAHRRLAVIDVSSASAQPFFAADGRTVLVYNGEIFNYIELRRELEQSGVRFRTSGDTEVLLAAYRHWGEECLSRLNGQFAFVIWDAARGRAFAARDRFGEKPLHYARLSTGGLAIASEMKALLAHPGVDDGVDDAAIDAFAIGSPDYSAAETPFRAIRRLRPAHAVWIDAAGSILREWRYWTPDFAGETISLDPASAAAEFRERLLEGLRLRMRSDVTVGASLSGGLDSSSLVALMKADGMIERGQLHHAISARFDDDPTLSEGPFIDSIVHRTGARALAVTPRGDQLGDESSALHYHQELPQLSASAYLEFCVRRAAHESGLTVMIDGQGADELLGGYQFYFAARQLDWMNRGDWSSLFLQSSAFRRRLRRAAGKYAAADRRIPPGLTRSPLVLAAVALANLMLPLFGRRPRLQPTPTPRDGVPDASGGRFFRHTLANGLLYATLPDQLVTADLNSMAFAVETRFPFLDHRLVDWCVRLPEDLLIRDGWMKWILRSAMEGLLPADVQWRADKLGFHAPLDRWLRDSLRGWAEERLFSGPIVERSCYDRNAIEALWRRHQAGEAGLSNALWRWISVNEWLRLGTEGVWRRGRAPLVADRAVEPRLGRTEATAS